MSKLYKKRYTLFGDLEGMTVAELKELLSKYKDTDVVDAYSDDYECDYFRFMESE